MPSSFHLIALISLLLISATIAKTQSNTNAVLLQVTKDPKTLQYITRISQRTPLVSLPLTVDLGGRYLWTNCDINHYVSYTYRFYSCQSAQCKNSKEDTFCNSCASPVRPGCHNDSCSLFSINFFAGYGAAGELAADVLSLQSTNGKNPTKVVSMPKFLFFCNDDRLGLFKALANGVKGIAGFGRTSISLATQFARYFKYNKIFAMCLSPSSKGVIFLGDGPYMFHPNINGASALTYTPLIINKGRWITQPSSDYFVGVTSIKINGKLVPINTTLLSIDHLGQGGTKFSTVNPYTVLESSIYYDVIKAFVKAARNVSRVTPVAPFDICYSTKSFGSTHLGPIVPVIDLVLQSEQVYWRIYGANSMVKVSKDVMCLAFVKQSAPLSAITIGGYQLENNLLQFNVAKSAIGFSSLIFRGTTCASFNFTST